MKKKEEIEDWYDNNLSSYIKFVNKLQILIKDIIETEGIAYN